MWNSKDRDDKSAIADSEEKSVESTDDKFAYDHSRTDSGFISGQNLCSELLSEEIRSAPDSGVIDDDPESKNTGEYMRLDSGVDVGLTESFSGLSLKNKELNNLNKVKSKKSTKAIEEKPQITEQPPWKLYYQQDEDGDTQLHIAIIHGFVEVVLSLVRMAPHPALLDIKNDYAQSALHLAVLTGQPRVVRRLLVSGAEASVQDRHGNTPLHLACMGGDMDSVRALTAPITVAELSAAGADSSSCQQLPPDLEQKNYDGEACVHLAAQGEHIDVLRHLVWYGADINAREGKSGRTPLHFAVEQTKPVLARFLLQECPNLLVETVTYAGQTAYQLTRDQTLLSDLLRRGAIPMEQDSDSDDYSSSEDSEIQFGTSGYFNQAFQGNNAIDVA